MILTTKTKVGIARVLYRAVATARSVAGRDGSHAVVTRRGLRWALDLNEGVDLSIFLFGAFERSTVELVESLIHAGDVALDIGANIGAHTLPMARAVGLSGRVIAFEPTSYAYNKLIRNIDLNPQIRDRVTAEQVMLVADAGAPLEPEIYSSWPLDRTEGLHHKHCGHAMRTDNARVSRLDDYVSNAGLQRIDLIKLDVDGHETNVLLGARRVLEHFRPRIIMELSPYVHSECDNRDADAFAFLIQLLSGLRYSMCTVDSKKALPLNPDYLCELVPDGAGINVLLTPSA